MTPLVPGRILKRCQTQFRRCLLLSGEAVTKRKLTYRVVDRASPRDQEFTLWDATLRGFGCRVLPSGKKVYLIYYRTRDGRQRRPTIGVHGVLTCREARQIARRWLAETARGGDPSGARQAQRNAATIKHRERYLVEHATIRNRFTDRLGPLGTIPVAGPAVTDEPVSFYIGQPAHDRGYVIPQAGRQIPEESIRLDPDRVRDITESTERVSSMLSNIFSGEAAEGQALAPSTPQKAPEVPLFHNTCDGLDARYGAFVTDLISRAQWSRSDLDTLARSFALMTDGALEAINEWAIDRYGDALLEEGEPMTVNATIIKQLRIRGVAHA